MRNIIIGEKRGDANRHNLLRNAVYGACRQASLSVRLKAGGGLGKDKALTRPADVLVSNPSGSVTVTSPLNLSIILKVGASACTAARAAEAAEVRKHSKSTLN